MSLRAALVVAALQLVACRRTELVGSLTCTRSADCAPPQSVCGVDGRCVSGCVATANTCIGASTCDPATGECTGAPPCTDDDECDAPASVCSLSSHECEAGCTLAGCADGLRCNPMTGHCCDPSAADCPAAPDAGPGCNGDSECVGAPANICSAGACVSGCATTGCTAPLTCDTTTGHCSTDTCTRDADCDPGSYCSQAQRCTVLAFGGAIACAGGTKVSYTCATKTMPDAFQSCAGAPGPSGCPYCIDGSCFHPGLCASAADCHRGDDCKSGLCIVQASECPSVVALTDVIKGVYAAGKEVCVRDVVTSLRSGYDGMNEIKLGNSPYLFVDVAPWYASAGVRTPSLGETVTVHGVVRWDAAHDDRELLPVDWISPP
jgi:hypothetical protein